MQRRRIYHLALLAMSFGLSMAHPLAQAQTWPQKQIRMIIPSPAGTAPDIVARLIADKMSRSLGQPVVIDNRGGAGGIVAMNALKAAPADGYTIAFAQASVVVVTPFTYKEATYDMDRDFDTVSIVGRTPMMFVTNPNNPARTLGDALAQAKAKPDQVAIGNPFRTSIPHLAAELAGAKGGARFMHVPFGTTAAGIQAVVAGDTQFYVDGVAPLLPLVKAGKLRAIAVASDTPLPGLEEYPLANKSLADINVYGWFGIFAPKGTPAAILQRLNADASLAQQQADLIAKFLEFGTYVTPGSAADAARFVKNERDLFGSVIKSVGVKPE